jgi:hypothetical protein
MADEKGLQSWADNASAVTRDALDSTARKIDEIVRATSASSSKLGSLAAAEALASASAEANAINGYKYLPDAFSVTSAFASHEAIARHISEQSLHGVGSVLAATSALTESLGRLPTLEAAAYVPPPEQLYLPALTTQDFEMTPPLFDTNERLDTLNESVAALVEVARNQANLTLTIRESTVQSGKTSAKFARMALWVAIISPIVSALIGIGVSVYLDRRNATADSLRLKEERSFRQQEIRVLGDISAQLASDAKARASDLERAAVGATVPKKSAPTAPKR